MATIKEYDSFKTQDGREIYLYQAVNTDGEWNNLYDRHVEENHPYLFSMLGVAERNGKYNNVKFYNQYRPLFRIEEPDD